MVGIISVAVQVSILDRVNGTFSFNFIKSTSYNNSVRSCWGCNCVTSKLLHDNDAEVMRWIIDDLNYLLIKL